MGGILNWWDGVELWLSGLGFVAADGRRDARRAALAYGLAVVLDGALGNGIGCCSGSAHQDEDRS